MSEYPGSVLAELEAAVAAGKKGHTLTSDQLRQVLEVVGGLVEAKNELVRENWRAVGERDAARRVLMAAADRLATCSELLSRCAERKAAA